MEIRVILAAFMFSIMVFPALAAEDEVNSGFGKDYFAGDPHPAFEDPSFFDIDSLAETEPAAGDDGELQTEGNQPANAEVPSAPPSEENRAVDTSKQ